MSSRFAYTRLLEAEGSQGLAVRSSTSASNPDLWGDDLWDFMLLSIFNASSRRSSIVNE